jgi:Protein of unknown function (DUF3618)
VAVSSGKKAGNHATSASHAGNEPTATPTDDADELQYDIERTREHLGQTVGQLAAKADVKAMARGKATELSERVRNKSGQFRGQAAARAEGARSQLAGKTAAARHRAQSASEGRIAQVREQVAAIGTPAWEATPEQVRNAVAKGAAGARRRRASLAIGVGVLVLGLLIIRRWRGPMINRRDD